MKKKLFNSAKFLLLLAGTITLLFSCQNNQGNELVEQNEYTGEELFKGIYFLTGDFASKLPVMSVSVKSVKNIREAKPDEAKYADDFIEDLIVNIKAIDSDYFNNFKYHLLSEDLYTISDAITSGREIIKAAGYRSSNYQDAFRLADDISQAGINFESEKIQNLDLNNTEDAQQFVQILAEDYNIDFKKYNTEVGKCIAIALVLVLAFTVNSVVHINLAYTYSVVEVAGSIANSDILVFEQTLARQVSEALSD